MDGRNSSSFLGSPLSRSRRGDGGYSSTFSPPFHSSPARNVTFAPTSNVVPNTSSNLFENSFSAVDLPEWGDSMENVRLLRKQLQVVQDIRAELGRKNAMIGTLRAENDALKQQCHHLQATQDHANQLEQRCAALSGDLAVAQQAASEWEGRAKALDRRVQEGAQHAAHLQEGIDTKDRSILNLEASMVGVQEEVADMKALYERERQRKQELEKMSIQVEENLSNALDCEKERARKLELDLACCKEDLADAKAQIAILSEVKRQKDELDVQLVKVHEDYKTATDVNNQSREQAQKESQQLHLELRDLRNRYHLFEDDHRAMASSLQAKEEVIVRALSKLKEADTADYSMDENETWDSLLGGMEAALETNVIEIQKKALELYNELFRKSNPNQAADLLLSFLKASLLDKLEGEMQTKAISICHYMLLHISEHLVDLVVLEVTKVSEILQLALSLLQETWLSQIDPAASWVLGILKNVPIAIWTSFLQESRLMESSAKLCQALLQSQTKAIVLIQVSSFLGDVVAVFRGSLPFNGIECSTFVLLLIEVMVLVGRDHQNQDIMLACARKLRIIASSCQNKDLFKEKAVTQLLVFLASEIEGALNQEMNHTHCPKAVNFVVQALIFMIQNSLTSENLVKIEEEGTLELNSEMTHIFGFFKGWVERKHRTTLAQRQILATTVGPFLMTLVENPLITELLWKSGALQPWVEMIMNLNGSAEKLVRLCQTQIGVWVVVQTQCLDIVCHCLVDLLWGCQPKGHPANCVDAFDSLDLRYMILEVLSVKEGFDAIIGSERVQKELPTCYQKNEALDDRCVRRWLLFVLLRCEMFLQLASASSEGNSSLAVLEILNLLMTQYVICKSEDESLPGGVEFGSNQVDVLSMLGELCKDYNFKTFVTQNWNIEDARKRLQEEMPFLVTEAPSFFNIPLQKFTRSPLVSEVLLHAVKQDIETHFDTLSMDNQTKDPECISTWLLSMISGRSKTWPADQEAHEHFCAEVREPFFNWFGEAWTFLANLNKKDGVEDADEMSTYLSSREYVSLNEIYGSQKRKKQKLGIGDGRFLKIPLPNFLFHLIESVLLVENPSIKQHLTYMGWSVSSLVSKILLGSFMGDSVDYGGRFLQQNFINILLGPEYCFYYLAYAISSIALDYKSHPQISDHHMRYHWQYYYHEDPQNFLSSLAIPFGGDSVKFWNFTKHFQQKFQKMFVVAMMENDRSTRK